MTVVAIIDSSSHNALCRVTAAYTTGCAICPGGRASLGAVAETVFRLHKPTPRR